MTTEEAKKNMEARLEWRKQALEDELRMASRNLTVTIKDFNDFMEQGQSRAAIDRLDSLAQEASYYASKMKEIKAQIEAYDLINVMLGK